MLRATAIEQTFKKSRFPQQVREKKVNACLQQQVSFLPDLLVVQEFRLNQVFHRDP